MVGVGGIEGMKMAGIAAMVRARRRWLIPPIVLLALILALVAAVHGRAASSTDEASQGDGDAGHAASSPTGRTGAISLTGAARAASSPLPEATPALRLEGLVIDADTTPVGGARVTLGGGRVVETEADGSFAFDGLAEGKYDLIAEHAAWYAEAQGVQLDDTSEPVTLTLARGATLVVHVTDPRGQPIAGAAVDLSPRTFVTGADGTARIRCVAADDEYVVVSAAGRARVREQVPTSDDPAATIDWTVVLAAGAEIAGSVVDQDGKPVAEAYVELAEPNGKRGESTFSDETGAWRLPDIGRGTYAVRASSKLHIASADLAIEHDGARPTTGVIVHVEPGGEIAGLVVDAAGAPVAEARVTTGSGSETTDAHGRFVAGGLGPDKYEVTASTPTLGAASQPVVLARGQHVDVKIVLAPSSLAGIVVDAAGAPVEDAEVFARAEVPNGVALEHTDAHGRFDLGGLPPGRYKIVAQRSGSQVEGAAVEVATSNRHVRLVVPDPAGITGRVLLDGKPVTYYGVAIDEDANASYSRPVPVRDPAGRFTQRDVAPGTFAVIIIGPGFARRVVEGVHVASGGMTDVGDISVTRGDSVRGRVVDARGAGIAGATVRITSRYSIGATGLRAILGGDFSATSDAGGYYEVGGQQASDDDRRIEATHPTSGTSGIRVLAAGQLELELELTASGSIDGTVVRPRSGVGSATATRVDDGDVHYDAEITAAGSFRFPQLPAGDYDVRVVSSNAQPPVRATVTAGARTVVVFERPAHPAELRVHAAGCSLISLRTAADEMLRLESCNEGRVTFPELAPGPYQLCLELSECRPVDVPATAVHTIEITR
jgi:protocatechuate 3,4-dioxygenase beta subunit